MDPKKIRLIYPPQYEGVYYPMDGTAERQRLGFTKDDWVAAAHGIMHPSKGYGQIMDWWAELVKTRPHWRLLLIGGSGEEERCRRQIAALKLERHVLMTGWLPSHDDVNKALNAADCLLVTRRNTPENQGAIPSSLFHNLALNKPTVVTGLPGMCEVVQDKVNGFAYEPDSFESFKNTLEFVCDHPDQTLEIAARGVQTAKESFDVNRCAQQYFELIAGAIQPQTAPSEGGVRDRMASRPLTP
jgi:glycosyltransferase involved in cell wall biosynthesis